MELDKNTGKRIMIMLWLILLIFLFKIGMDCQNQSDSEKLVQSPGKIKTFDIKLLPARLPPSDQSWELYTFKIQGRWFFTLTTGDLRLKIPGEVTFFPNQVGTKRVKITVDYIGELKTLLKRLPEGENVYWASRSWLKDKWKKAYKIFCLPDQDTMDEIILLCRRRRLRLEVLE